MNYLIHGSDDYLIELELKKIFPKGKQGVELVTYYGDEKSFDIKQFILETRTTSLFEDEKFVILRDPLFLTTKGSLSDKELDYLKEYLSHNQQSTLIFLVKNISLDARKKTTKLLKEKCQEIHIKDLSPGEIKNFIKKDLIKEEIILSSSAWKVLENRLPGNITDWKAILEKLRLFNEEVTPEVISALVPLNFEENVFFFGECIMNQDYLSANKTLLDFKLLKLEPIMITLTLASQIRFNLFVQHLKSLGFNKFEIAQELKANPYRVTKNLNNKASLKQMLFYLKELAILEQGMKKGLIDKQHRSRCLYRKGN